MLQVNDKNFDAEVYEENKPVLVAFMADWCWVCREHYKPELQKMSEKYGEHVKFCNVDIDESPETKAYFGVEKTPLTVLFLDGKEMSQLNAAWPEDIVLQFINDSLGIEIVQIQ